MADTKKLTLDDIPDIQKFQFGLLVQGNDSIADYYSKLKRCNDINNFSEDHLRYVFIRGLTPENVLCIRMYGLEHNTLDELIEKLSGVENTDFMTGFKDYISQPANNVNNKFYKQWISIPNKVSLEQ